MKNKEENDKEEEDEMNSKASIVTTGEWEKLEEDLRKKEE